MGSAIHAHLADRVQLGGNEAFGRLAAQAKHWDLDEDAARIFEARCRAFRFAPPPGVLVEVPLALLADGDVRSCAGARGEYTVPDGALLPLTLDAMWSEPEPLTWIDDTPRCPEGSVLWVIDYKTGSDENVDAIENNRQLLAAALLAARYTDAATVLPAAVLVRAGEGEWDTLEAPVTVDELAWVEEEIRTVAAACTEQARLLEAGEPLALIEGNHCLYCPARDRCPAKVAMVRKVLGSDEAFDLAVPLSAADRTRLATMLPQLERWTVKAKALLRADVDLNGAIDLGDGRVWGPHVVMRDELDPGIGVHVLAKEIGEDKAHEALSITLTKRGAEEAIKAAHAEAGIKRKVGPTIRRVLARMHEAGAIRKVQQIRWGAHKVRRDLDAADEPETTEETTT